MVDLGKLFDSVAGNFVFPIKVHGFLLLLS